MGKGRNVGKVRDGSVSDEADVLDEEAETIIPNKVVKAATGKQRLSAVE